MIIWDGGARYVRLTCPPIIDGGIIITESIGPALGTFYRDTTGFYFQPIEALGSYSVLSRLLGSEDGSARRIGQEIVTGITPIGVGSTYQIAGNSALNTTPTTGQALLWNGTAWIASNLSDPVAGALSFMREPFGILSMTGDITGSNQDIVAMEININVDVALQFAEVYYTSTAGSGSIKVIIYEANNIVGAGELQLIPKTTANIVTYVTGYCKASFGTVVTLSKTKRYFVGYKRAVLNGNIAVITIPTLLRSSQLNCSSGYGMTMIKFTPQTGDGITPTGTFPVTQFAEPSFPYLRIT
jgi:hypothetical protein